MTIAHLLRIWYLTGDGYSHRSDSTIFLPSPSDQASVQLTAPESIAYYVGVTNYNLGQSDSAYQLSISVDSDGAPVNDAPSGSDSTVSTLEDTAHAFAVTDFGFSDPADTPANSLLAVRMSTLPAAGNLTLSGNAVTAGQFIAAADIVAGNLVFTPAAAASGTGYTGFTFQVQDDGGTASGGIDLDPTPNQITIDVTAVNDAPSGADRTVTTHEDYPYVLSAADFGFSDPADNPAKALLAVSISTLPTAGSLTLSGVAVSAGQSIAAADLAVGNLVFTPDGNASRTAYATFSFQVQDNGGTANGGADLDPTPNQITIDVTAVNDAPSGADKTVSTREDSPYAFSAADFVCSDSADIPANGLLAVRVSTLPAAGSLTVSGVAVSTGQYIAVTDIMAGQFVFTPTTDEFGDAYASFSFQIQDGGGTEHGGSDLDPTPNLLTIDVRQRTPTDGDDHLFGTAGDDLLDGLAGSDVLEGLTGNDQYVVDVVTDTVVELPGAGIDRVDVVFLVDNTYGLPDHVEHARVANATPGVNLAGNTLDNELTGNETANQLNGEAGNDTLDGGGGDDTLNGGDGDDTLLFDASDGSVDGGAGTDSGVFSGASTAQARAFAMAAHNLERLQWSVAGNTWNLVLNGDGSRTETVSDTAASESGFASRTTRLAVSGAVDWIDTRADNGVRTYNDLDDLGDQAWTQLFQVYDGSGLVDFRDYRNDDGTRLVIDDDNLGNQGWTQIQQKYDTQDREDYRDYRLDDGRRQVVDYDQANNQNFVRLDQLYDTLGREDYRDYRLDDGRRQVVDYDQANNQSWSQVTQLYDALAREDYRDYRLDDGRRQLVDYDQANNQAWSRSTQLYDPLDRQDYRDYVMDDGSRTFIDYDQAGQFAWTEWQKEFDAAGTLLHQRITYDSGDIVYQ
ncbi:Ig-like domain-containing protein [Accumulibacter sp.]|uniref:Ig-like domain-containing protein n=1 Tax=Accumulibacter sp. TaxID=2053492 RepID=UPI0025FA7B5C|nr:Ig-like domain-containing protein [Accumulibacter sp.]MCM8614289.1 Ig-like domain-containing protein [Accumulibacter sp.]MCM8634565.1 Ig-like domain-containing protein [Accumulibacter sp.]